MDVGVPELLIILVVVLVIFGGAKLPQLARSLGQAQHEFKKGASGHHDDDAENTPAQAETRDRGRAGAARDHRARPDEARDPARPVLELGQETSTAGAANCAL